MCWYFKTLSGKLADKKLVRQKKNLEKKKKRFSSVDRFWLNFVSICKEKYHHKENAIVDL